MHSETAHDKKRNDSLFALSETQGTLYHPSNKDLNSKVEDIREYPINTISPPIPQDISIKHH